MVVSAPDPIKGCQILDCHEIIIFNLKPADLTDRWSAGKEKQPCDDP